MEWKFSGLPISVRNNFKKSGEILLLFVIYKMLCDQFYWIQKECVSSFRICPIWDKVFKNGPSKICGKQPLKNLNSALSRPYPFKFFKGCLPQILFGPFFNTLSHMSHMSYIWNALKRVNWFTLVLTVVFFIRISWND